MTFFILVGYSLGWAWGVAVVAAVLECACIFVMVIAKLKNLTGATGQEEPDENSALINNS